MVDHDASAKTMITTTPIASADRMALTLGNWVRRTPQDICNADNAERDGSDGGSWNDD